MRSSSPARILVLPLCLAILGGGCGSAHKSSPTPIPQVTLPALRWIAYSPTNADPNRSIEPTIDSIEKDLLVLREAGFTGLVTYSASGIVGRELPRLAQAAGFQGLIVGVWDVANQDEMAAAAASSLNPIVLGFCVGNEGLHKRYDMSQLRSAISKLKSSTAKPVTTTEEIDDYVDEELLAVGDWVFPNAHPYFHGQTEPDLAVRWTDAAFTDLERRAGARFVMFKEVGLPTAGDTTGDLSEENQRDYYQELAKTEVRFVYFEAFDMEWKTTLPIEPHWGLFRSDRSPKLLASSLMPATPSPSPSATDSAFYVYRDIDYSGNHFTPSGYMGDVGDIKVGEGYASNPHSGKTSIRIEYTGKGSGPNQCSYNPPCKWAGVYWQEPPNNWGNDIVWRDRGYDLSSYGRLTVWARADKPISVELKVGGIVGDYGDSLRYPRGIVAQLTPEWQQFTIDLSGSDLTHIIGGFVWSLSRDALTSSGLLNSGAVFYLDDIRFEQD
jgi:exo-beta-1,3-glucanase (GH17 family)